MSKIDVTKLQIEGVRCLDHVRIAGVAGVSIRADAGAPAPLIDWEHRCIVHCTEGAVTIVPFENVMYITAKLSKEKL